MDNDLQVRGGGNDGRAAACIAIACEEQQVAVGVPGTIVVAGLCRDDVCVSTKT